MECLNGLQPNLMDFSKTSPPLKISARVEHLCTLDVDEALGL
jgi:hypothetical protein